MGKTLVPPKARVEQMIAQLKAEPVNTWFDLGLFIDRIRDNRKIPAAEYVETLHATSLHTFEGFLGRVAKGGIAFVTYLFAIDGVTVEAQKYAKALRNILYSPTNNSPLTTHQIHYIAGNILPEAECLIDPATCKYIIKEINGFDNWNLYKDFFFTKLQRGSKEYNKLIIKFWKDVLVITEKLGNYIEKNNIQLLYLINVCSNPGNVSLALSVVIISEYMGIPVINNNHDFYWEGGNRKVDIINKRLKPGPRDFFFTNSHLGEFFSQIEVLCPWESRSWMTVNINNNQSSHVIEQNGHNPANVCEIGTAVDTKIFTTITKRNKIKAFQQVQAMLSNYKKKLHVYTPDEVIKTYTATAIASASSTATASAATATATSSTVPLPILLGYTKSSSFDFVNNNIVFLQPTRLMPRKKIEVNLKLVSKLFENEDFITKFRTNPQLKLSILVTGPIPLGQFQYFVKLLHSFSEFLNELKPKYRQRVFFGFLFSEFDKKRFKNKFDQPIDIPELYNIASLILLPSETEGRGLPIIEATACGIPIFCRRYYPEKVYSEVIGEHLEEKDRLKVLEFDGTRIPDKLVNKIIGRVFFPQNYIDETEHNMNVVQKRYSIESLQAELKHILYRLYLQLLPNEKSLRITVKYLNEYKKCVSFTNKDLENIINTKNRHYLPGFGRLTFMLYLKSLIDPSYFRVEEQQIRGMAMNFAQKCCSFERYSGNQSNVDKILADKQAFVKYSEESANTEIQKLHQFYNCIDNIFHYYHGEIKIQHDHSFAYRHRSKKYYPWQDFTHQELTGLINMIYHKVAASSVKTTFKISPHFFTDWNLALFQLTNSSNLAIDDRKLLTKMFQTNVPIAYFPGEYIKYELEFFVLQSIRSRLNLKIIEELTEDHLKKHYKNLATVYIFCMDNSYTRWITAEAVENYIAGSDVDRIANPTNVSRIDNPVNPIDKELNLLYKYGICKVVRTKQWCVGIHFPQLGEEALKILSSIKRQKGFIIANGDNAPVMTDIVDIDRFHIGKAEKELTSKILGIPLGSGFIQFVPAGVRTTLAYPTPVQTAKDFSQAIKRNLFKKLCKKLGQQQVFNLLKKDAETKGTPINIFLDNLKERELYRRRNSSAVDYSYVSGIYKDGLPWSGVITKVNTKDQNWNFATLTGNGKTQLVTDFVKDFSSRFKKNAKIAWNGGYILNAELVGKLGLPESYIGSPLGLLIINKKVLCPPLFNKPAFIIYADGRLDIQRVNCRNGIIISDGKHTIDFSPPLTSAQPESEKLGIGETERKKTKQFTHSPIHPFTDSIRNSKDGDLGGASSPCFYDLMYDEETIDGNGNVIVRLAGNQIKEVIYTKKNQKVKVIPVGLTLSIPGNLFPGDWDVGSKNIPANKTLQIKIPPLNPTAPEKEKRGIGETERKKTKLQSYGLDRQFTDSPIHRFTDSGGFRGTVDLGGVAHAVEAGPMLINNGIKCIDMKIEGWKTKNSINTQAARLDFTDMRGPKIAVGLDKKGNLMVLMINGRIRESVGATHHDMADIMLRYGMEKAMGFDPGGSATLVVNGKILNISPYNHQYEKDIYSLPPEPRPVANAVIGWQR